MSAEVKPRTRVTGEARDQLRTDLVNKYNAGSTIRQLAEETGRSYGFVHRILTEAELEMRSRGGKTHKKG